MQFVKAEKKDIFTTLYYELTWPVSWELIIAFLDVMIETDFSKDGVEEVRVGKSMGAKGKNVTKELKKADYHIKGTSFAKEEASYISLQGNSKIMNVNMRITFWNQLGRCLLELAFDEAIEEHGEHYYDKYVDSVEIRGYIDRTIASVKKSKPNN